MATGEKATLRLPAPFDHARLDVYPYFPAVQPTSGLSLAEIDRPLPFLLYLHDGILPFHSGSRIDVPPQIVAWCKSRGVPLLSLDYTLLSTPPSTGAHTTKPHTLEDVWASVEACWRFINNSAVLPAQSAQVDVEETLSWQIIATGHGAESDTGTQPLDDEWREFQPRGIDGRAGMIWGTGAGGYLASLAAARLHNPPPIAVVLERPLLDLNAALPTLPALPRIVREPPPFPYTDTPSFPGISDRLWFEGMDANQEEAWRKNNDMDVRRPLPGERDGAQALRMAIDAFEYGRRRGSTIASAFPRGTLPASSAEVITGSQRPNQPFPPTFVLTGPSERATQDASTFLDAVRATSPEGAVADKLLQAGSRNQEAAAASASAPSATSALKLSSSAPQRYLQLTLDDKTQSVPLLGGRTHLTNLPLTAFQFLSLHLADALFLRASREGADGSGVVEELRRQAHQLLADSAEGGGLAKL
ncbi:hypothetical protein OC842_006775 [Tilletia horrida]|uniref:Uncharacterized protein n=1 Tax=Tilletia horrida TaxID=155126 RepID=A0AAN6G5E3_9BASI|nr:hypothetical protein OC842_006775 [Tilletia horrida]